MTYRFCLQLRGGVYSTCCTYAGADPGEEGAPDAPPPPPKIGKNMIFWRKIVIFHTKYPKDFGASLRSALFFQVRPLT
jgi:hypothetical protein